MTKKELASDAGSFLEIIQIYSCAVGFKPLGLQPCGKPSQYYNSPRDFMRELYRIFLAAILIAVFLLRGRFQAARPTALRETFANEIHRLCLRLMARQSPCYFTIFSCIPLELRKFLLLLQLRLVLLRSLQRKRLRQVL